MTLQSNRGGTAVRAGGLELGWTPTLPTPSGRQWCVAPPSGRAQQLLPIHPLSLALALCSRVACRVSLQGELSRGQLCGCDRYCSNAECPAASLQTALQALPPPPAEILEPRPCQVPGEHWSRFWCLPKCLHNRRRHSLRVHAASPARNPGAELRDLCRVCLPHQVNR